MKLFCDDMPKADTIMPCVGRDYLNKDWINRVELPM
jgi:hypothetical protein